MIIFSNSSISSMGRSALDNVHPRGIQRNGFATVRIYIFEYRPMSTHTGTHHAPRPDADLCLTHLHKYPDPQIRFPMVLPTGKPTKIHGLPRVATCLTRIIHEMMHGLFHFVQESLILCYLRAEAVEERLHT